jgi:hypothetical protein
VRLWDQQSVWSQAADRVKRSIGKARTAGLILGIAAAGFATAASQVMVWSAPLGKTLAFLAAVAAGLAPPAAARSGPRSIRDWTRLRSVSEALKSEIYTYLARVDPYRAADATKVLIERIDRLHADTSDLIHHTINLAPAQRPLPAVTDVDSYADVRLKTQISDYYRPRAAHMSRRMTLVRRAGLALAATAAVLSAVSAVFGVNQASGWVATITTVTAAVTTHAAASRYAYQELEFARTTAELESLLVRRTEATAKVGPEADDGFVTHCEQVISAQNEGWMTKWAAK